MDFFDNYQYVIAWGVYILAGMGSCRFWWKVTEFVQHQGWRELLRGFASVIVFTPWWVGDSFEFYAPAVMVLMMDLLSAGSKNGLQAALVLLFTGFIMLIVLTIRQFLRGRSHDL